MQSGDSDTAAAARRRGSNSTPTMIRESAWSGGRENTVSPFLPSESAASPKARRVPQGPVCPPPRPPWIVASAGDRWAARRRHGYAPFCARESVRDGREAEN